MNTQNIQTAVSELRKRLTYGFGDDVQLYLFGSVARGNYSSDSDIDVLVLVPGKLTASQEEKIFDAAYDVELEYDVVFGIIAYSKDFWTSTQARSMPLCEHIRREGIPV
jgi:predicted nucleotidyltransferase